MFLLLYCVERGEVLFALGVLCEGIVPLHMVELKVEKIGDFIQNFPWRYTFNPAFLQ